MDRGIQGRIGYSLGRASVFFSKGPYQMKGGINQESKGKREELASKKSAGHPIDPRSLVQRRKLSYALLAGAISCPIKRTARCVIVLESLPDSGCAAAQQCATDHTVMAVAAQPANSRSKCGVGTNHSPIVKRPKSCPMRVQEPCAGSAAADHHQFQRRLLARQYISKASAYGRSAGHGENVFVVLWADASEVALINIARLRV